jgi:MFS family permease
MSTTTVHPSGKSGTGKRLGPWSMLALVAVCEFLAMTLWFSATAVTRALTAEFPLSAGGTAWLTMAVQGGFVLGTLASALLNLPDVLNPRRLFAVGCLVAAAANTSLIFISRGGEAIVLRFVTGVALAWVYPPGMKIATGWIVDRRGTALGIVVGALTLGTAFPHYLAGMSATVPWRSAILVSSLCALVAAVIMVLVVRDGPHVSATARFDPHAVARVFRDRGTRLATLGYLGHMWELYAMWTWVATFAAASFASRGVREPATWGSLAAFAAIASGLIGCVVAGVLADRRGKARIAGAALAASGLCCVGAPLLFHGPPPLVLGFLIFWGATVVADSAQFSALVAQYSPADRVGTALTVQICAGFLLTMASIRLMPVLADLVGWQWVFLSLAPGPAFGYIAMAALGKAERPSP